MEGEGNVHATGSRSGRGLVVQVTDETGKPVEGARVSFLLPPDGATGTFVSGLRSDIALTDGAGVALLPTVLWNRTAGPLNIRVTVVHGEARAGIAVSQYLSDSVAASSSRREHGGRRRRSGWLAIGVIAAGAAAGGLALGMGRSAGGGGSAGAVVQPPTTPAVVIGSPDVVVGRP